MKYQREYRDAALAQRYAHAIETIATFPCTIMEVCGGQTHAIIQYGVDQLLPSGVELIHGPGCPVCVTPAAIIDSALQLAAQPHITLCSFGDMLRVPGSRSDLLSVKASGGDVRVVYSPMDALTLAERHPDRQIVFFAVGFETTAPANAMTVFRAAAQGIRNFSLLVAHVLVPPAIVAIAATPERRIDAFLAAGHVCTIMGINEYQPIAERYQLPIVVTGFEPADILQGILMCVRQLASGQYRVENQYARAVRARGNPEARRLIRQVFEVVDQHWRGMGTLPASGLRLRDRYADFCAERKFALARPAESDTSSQCISGQILTGRRRPDTCAAFGKDCTPNHPLGAPMVSSEGACAAYYRYRVADSSPLKPNGYKEST